MAELKDILHTISVLSDKPDPYALKKLIDSLRVEKYEFKEDPNLANNKIKALNSLLQEHPDYATGLAVFLLTLINQYHQMSIYTDTGILSDHSFASNLMRLVGHRFIPLLPAENSILELVDYLFDGKNDEHWLASVDDELWDQFINLILVDDAHSNLVATAKNNILNAMVILSYRISGIGLHHDLMHAYPELIDYSAAFVAQSQEAVLFANGYRDAHKFETLKDVIPNSDIDPSPLLVMVEQCQTIVNNIRKRIYKTGISIHLTNRLLRLEQSLKRMRILSELLSNHHQNRDKAILELTQIIIVSAKKRYSIRYLINTNTKLLSKKITDNSGRVGEHYITTDNSGYFKMFKKAAIGGFVIAIMATLKILSSSLELAPMGVAFLNSMIYGLGFVFIHIIHGTVATKQPAMTAAAIASTISNSTAKKTKKLAKVSQLIVDIIRTQFVAIMGNVLIAMPMALIISYLWLQLTGEPIIDIKTADKLIHELNPYKSAALFHAAIAGVYLFMAGLIAGYYDNLAIFNNIGPRIANHKLLLKIAPKHWTEKLGNFVEQNLGAIMGNFLFGVFLGSTATVGYIFGLPLDIRHIAFSSSNFAHGLFNLPSASITYALIFISLIGVSLIGIINLLVSFTLAMIVALRSKDVKFAEWKNISKILINHLLAHPRDFIMPRPEPMQYSGINNKGDVIFEEVTQPKKNMHLQQNFAVRRLSDFNKSSQNEPIGETEDKPVNTDVINTNYDKTIAPTKTLSTTQSRNDEKGQKLESTHPKDNEQQTNIILKEVFDENIINIENEEIPTLDKADTSDNASKPDTTTAKKPLPKPDKPPNLP